MEQRHREGPGAHLFSRHYAMGCALHFMDKAMKEVHAGRTQTFTPFKVPDEAIGCGFHEAVRGVLSHHMVIRKGKIANYHPYPPTPWNANPARHLWHAWTLPRTPCQNTPIFEEAGRITARASTSCAPCAVSGPVPPCGVHMYLGDGKVLKQLHTPTGPDGPRKKSKQNKMQTYPPRAI